MAENWRDFDNDSLDVSLRAALDCFAAHGYHGTSIRQIADSAGLSVPGIYHHHRSKQVLLDKVVGAAMEELLVHTRAAEKDSDGTPAGRFDNIVTALILFHLARRQQAFVASTEMRSMAPEVRSVHVRSRDEQQHMITSAIADGIATGEFDCPSPVDAARAISSLCASIASWYRNDGTLGPDQIVEQYLGFCRRIAGQAQTAPGRRP